MNKRLKVISIFPICVWKSGYRSDNALAGARSVTTEYSVLRNGSYALT
jgi:hypothetical protein